MGRRLVETAELARELSVTTRTLQRWRREGLITPAEETLGGHARWDVDAVREQIRQLRSKEE